MFHPMKTSRKPIGSGSMDRPGHEYNTQSSQLASSPYINPRGSPSLHDGWDPLGSTVRDNSNRTQPPKPDSFDRSFRNSLRDSLQSTASDLYSKDSWQLSDSETEASQRYSPRPESVYSAHQPAKMLSSRTKPSSAKLDADVGTQYPPDANRSLRTTPLLNASELMSPIGRRSASSSPVAMQISRESTPVYASAPPSASEGILSERVPFNRRVSSSTTVSLQTEPELRLADGDYSHNDSLYSYAPTTREHLVRPANDETSSQSFFTPPPPPSFPSQPSVYEQSNNSESSLYFDQSAYALPYPRTADGSSNFPDPLKYAFPAAETGAAQPTWPPLTNSLAIANPPKPSQVYPPLAKLQLTNLENSSSSSQVSPFTAAKPGLANSLPTAESSPALRSSPMATSSSAATSSAATSSATNSAKTSSAKTSPAKTSPAKTHSKTNSAKTNSAPPQPTKTHPEASQTSKTSLLGIGQGSSYVRRLRAEAGETIISRQPASLPLGLRQTTRKPPINVKPEFLRRAMDIRYTHLPPRMLQTEVDDDDEFEEDVGQSISSGHFGSSHYAPSVAGSACSTSNQLVASSLESPDQSHHSSRPSSPAESIVEQVGRIKLFVANPDAD